MRIYADNAATTKMRACAIEAYLTTAEQFYGNASSLHSEGQRAKEVLERCRIEIAELLCCKAQEVYFTSGGSEADRQAISSAARYGAVKGKRKIISSTVEHHAVLHTLNALEKEGFEIVLVPVDERGFVSAKEIDRQIDGNTALVSVMTANNEIGTIEPVREIGELCRKRGVLFHTDAVQAVGHIPINLNELQADYLALSAHKFGGAKGTGVLYARTGAPVFPLIMGGAQERGKRAGTEDIPSIAAMTQALKEAVSNMHENCIRVTRMRDKLIEGLSKIQRSILNGDREKRLAGNVSFCFEGCEGEALLLYLDDLGVAASSGSACTSGSLEPSHVLLAIGRKHEIAHGSLRLTINEDTTEQEIDYLINAVTEVVARVRSMSPVWRECKSIL